MEGRGTVDGTIQYLLGDAPFTLIDPATTPVAGETVTFTNLATDYQAEAVTDGAGGFVSPPLPLGAYQADVAPGECLYAGWDGCLSFTRFDLSAPGERQTTMMAVVPPVGTLGWMPWATSVTPSIGQRGVDAVTVFGRDFAPDPGGGGVALIYFSVANDDPGGAFDPVNSTADEITGAIPAAYDQAAGYVFGEGWGLDRSYSNPLPFTILP
jgi:hypothetical protein